MFRRFAEEIIDLVEEKGVKKATQEVDVVTTATFGPMCSSGAYLNIGHSKPKIKLGGGKVYLNNIPAYAGFAAVDIYLGATALPEDDPRNEVFPGKFEYGGGHAIQDLVAGNRNAYQNYNVAVNLSDKTIYTYMGVLKANMGNANYCSAGQLSPLLNDPLYKTIGIGSRIFLGGGTGYVIWQGTQHNPTAQRKDNDVPSAPAGTLAVIGDLKEMSSEYLVGTTMPGYGVTLTVGIGIPIPILNEEICRYTAVKDEEIWAQIVDYSSSYPLGKKESLGEVNYAQLKSGKVLVKNRDVLTGSLSSYSKAKKIATIFKEWIQKGRFLLSEPVAYLPGPDTGYAFKPLKER